MYKSWGNKMAFVSDFLLLIVTLTLAIGFLIFIARTRLKDAPRKGSMLSSLIPRNRKYYNLQKGEGGRLDGDHAIIPAGNGKVHITFRVGSFWSERKRHKDVPAWAMKYRNYDGVSCLTPEGMLEIQYYDTYQSAKELRPYLETIKTLRHGYLYLQEHFDLLIDAMRESKVGSVTVDMLKRHKNLISKLSEQRTRAATYTPLIETTLEEKKRRELSP